MNNYDSLESLLGDEEELYDVDRKRDAVEDSIHSGESKIKNFKFDPKAQRCPHDVQKTIDFWQFIEKRKDLFPQQGSKIASPTKKNKCKEHELTWKEILEMLKAKKMDKVANRGHRGPCHLETCMEEAERKEKNLKRAMAEGRYVKDSDDDFLLDSLSDFDPQKVTLADAEAQTDPIETEDKETSTDLWDTYKEMQDRFKGLDELLKEAAAADLTGYFECICDDPCAFLPYPTGSSHSTESAGKVDSSETSDKCTCSCGQISCLCSLCAEILTKIENARDSFEKLSQFEVEKCPCSNLACVCLEDYRQLLDIKLEINRTVREITEDEEAKFGLPMECRCSCGQFHCPCKVVLELMVELDELMGYKDKPLMYTEKELDSNFGVDVCRCQDQDENDGDRCTCLSYYRQQIEEKIQLNTPSPKTPSIDSLKRGCTGECVEECILGTCPETIEKEEKVVNVEKIVESESPRCVCSNQDCIQTRISRHSILDNERIISDSNEKIIPPAPCNSIASL